MGNTFGKAFRVTTFGESHGPGIGLVIDGCPPNVAVNSDDIHRDMERRRPGQSEITTARSEFDKVEILSGIHKGMSTGAPIAMLIKNNDARPDDYSELSNVFRPSHADYTYQAKYGTRSTSGGGRASARETAARVAAGAVARSILSQQAMTVLAWVQSVGKTNADVNPNEVTTDSIERNIVRCPDQKIADSMIAMIKDAKDSGDSLGGTICAIAKGVPAGLGEPVFDKLEADLAKAMMSLPATKGFEIGSGFGGTTMKGSEHNDEFVKKASGTIGTKTNHSGGIQGGISNGENIIMRIAFKPTSTITLPQQSVNNEGNATTLTPKGRHDPCVLPRAVPIVEAMIWLTLCDHWLRHRAQCLS